MLPPACSSFSNSSMLSRAGGVESKLIRTGSLRDNLAQSASIVLVLRAMPIVGLNLRPLLV
jgi:hypothetical protein